MRRQRLTKHAELARAYAVIQAALDRAYKHPDVYNEDLERLLVAVVAARTGVRCRITIEEAS